MCPYIYQGCFYHRLYREGCETFTPIFNNTTRFQKTIIHVRNDVFKVLSGKFFYHYMLSRPSASLFSNFDNRKESLKGFLKVFLCWSILKYHRNDLLLIFKMRRFNVSFPSGDRDLFIFSQSCFLVHGFH